MSETATATEQKQTPPPPACERTIREIVADLRKPVSKRHLSTRKQGGKDITYIAWHHVEEYLDYYAAGWSKEIRAIDSIAGNVVMTVRITIPAKDGSVFRDATGCEGEDKSGYGDPFSNSESMALRRAAANFGLGRYLYDK